jgi:hypothetical protein
MAPEAAAKAELPEALSSYASHRAVGGQYPLARTPFSDRAWRQEGIYRVLFSARTLALGYAGATYALPRESATVTFRTRRRGRSRALQGSAEECHRRVPEGSGVRAEGPGHPRQAGAAAGAREAARGRAPELPGRGRKGTWTRASPTRRRPSTRRRRTCSHSRRACGGRWRRSTRRRASALPW